MTTILAAIAAVSLLGLFYVYAGYGLALRVAAAFVRARPAPEPAGNEWPRLTVLVTAFNEERAIAERIANILACDYPAHRLELVVASDGSTDATDSIVQGARDPRVRLFRPGARGGKSMTQNLAVSTANGDIVVFTDADTVFDRKFLLEISRPFLSEEVGAVDGHLGFQRGDDGDLGASQGYYWRYELSLRELESRLGLLAVSSGACMAVRRALLRPLPADVGEDCVVPLDVVEQGRRVVHAAGALAFDRMQATPAGELRARTRMTLRNWKGTWLHAQLLNPLRRPGYAWALWSHKLLRWLSPFMLVLATLACVALAGDSAFFAFLAAGFGVFYVLGLVGWWAVRRGPSIPVAGTVFSFLLANAGFLFGVVGAARGLSVTRYANADKP
jgi:cellulose synthase/poly-beta-1,6-N-acetylglucosamine synthase-like glycosyltransferase